MGEPSELPPGVTADNLREFKRIIARCWIVAGMLIELPLEALDRQSSRAETVGPMLYPGIWRDNAKAIMEDREMIRALVTAQRDVMTTSPSLAELAPIISAQVDGYGPLLDDAFSDIFRRVNSIPPAVILSALVRYIARRVPEARAT